MKKISKLFTILAILITNIMCIFVTYVCTSGYYNEIYQYTSAPWEIGLLFIIPFSIVIIFCCIISYIAKKKGK